MALTPIGLNIPAQTDAFDPATDFGDLATSLVGRVVVPVANTAARDALAVAVPPTTAAPLLVIRADAPTTLEISTAPGVWDTIAGGTPAQTVNTFGAGGPFTNTSPAIFTTATWSFPPPRSGIAHARCVLDVTGTGAFGYAAFSVAVNGVDQQPAYMYQGAATLRAEIPALAAMQRVRVGTPVSLVLKLAVFSASGSATVNSGRWEVNTF